MKTKRLVLRSLVLTSSLIFSLTTAGLVQSGEHDMADEITTGDAGVRDDDKNQDKSTKQRRHMKEGAKPKKDNSAYSTDGVEPYEPTEAEQEITGTGPKLEGRY
jgi:uncharacterized protein YlxP (DUF503 family)